MLESNTFNQELSSSEAKLVHCSLAVVGLSADKINILQHVKCPFSAVALAVKMLDEMNMVCHITEEPVIYCCLIFIFKNPNRIESNRFVGALFQWSYRTSGVSRQHEAPVPTSGKNAEQEV